ncbi:MAG: amino acid adenylation domain-containing protein, partial [Cellulosilyticaceae bacterium]
YVAPANDRERLLVAIWQEVLKVEQVGVMDNYRYLGGDSIKAIQVMVRLADEGYTANVRDIIESVNIRELSDKIKQSESVESLEQATTKDYYEISAAQQSMYTLQQLSPELTTYNIPTIMRIEGQLNKAKLETVFKVLLTRHEALRTSFHARDGRIVQKVHQVEALAFEVEQYTSGSEAIEVEVERFIRPFDLSQAPLVRVGINEISEEQHILMIDMHHIISDGRTVDIVTEEFIRLYSGEALPLPQRQYKDFSEWQNKQFKEGKFEVEKAYWRGVFEKQPEVLNLPYDYPRPAFQSFKGARFDFEISQELREQLETLARNTDTTVYMILLATYNMLLAKYSGQEDIVVGTPVTGRTNLQMENIAGMFVNTLALRHQVVGTMKYLEFLEQVKTSVLEGMQHQILPFEQVVQCVVSERDPAHNPIFDVMFNYQNYDSKELKGDVIFKPLEIEGNTSKVDITLNIMTDQKGMKCAIEYCSELFKKDTVEKIAYHYASLLERITQDSTKNIEEYEILLSEEKEKILYKLNGTDTEYSKDKTLTRLFEEQVRRMPYQRAIGYEETFLTYEQLNQRANSLAHKLRNLGVKNESIVGIKVERSLEMMIGILGILKAGGAYMPIGPNYPQDRIAYMLQETEAQIVLAQEQFVDTIQHPNIINLNDEALYQGNQENLEPINSPNSLAYVMYTSGSTGRPKGVMIEHTSVVNQMEWRQGAYPLGPNDVMMQKTPFTFDISVAELFWWMLGGASLYFLKPGGEKDPQMILETIEAQNITTIHFVPSMMSVFLDYYEAYQGKYDLSSLKRLISGGEALTVAQTEKFNRLLHKTYGVTMHNLYGPTEATIEVSYYDCPTSDKVETILIGKPCNNSRLYILDAQKQLLPIGVIGELYIAGTGVARGYLKREDLTAEKFMVDPYYEGQRMYRSGDLARWLPNGEVEYLGRMDNQVKIKGFRIELGEIEDTMTEHICIHECAVIVEDDGQGNSYLCGYYTGLAELSVDELRRHTLKKLPEYMVPTYFMKLDSMPLSANGKLDRKALPRLGAVQPVQESVENEMNVVEQVVVEVYQEVLKGQTISLTNHFNYMGGDSIKAIQVVVKLAERGYEVAVKDIIQSENIRILSTKLTPKVQQYAQGIVESFVEMIPVQICFFEFNYVDMHIWNMPVMYYSETRFDEDIVRTVVQEIIKHHDALRMVFREEDGRRTQYMRGLDQNLFDLMVYDLRGIVNPEAVIEQRANEIQASINLEEGPLVKVGLFKTQHCDYLLFVVHHLVMDFTSLQIVQEDMFTAYQQLIAHHPVKLPQKTASFKEWSEIIYRYAKSSQILEELDYWSAIDQATIPRLPKEYVPTNRQVKNLTHTEIYIPYDTTEKFISKGMQNYGATPNEMILTMIGQAFKAWCGQTAIQLRIAANGKNWSYEPVDISRTVGWFSISYPMVITSESEEYGENIQSTMDRLRNVPGNGSGYDVLRYITLPQNGKDLQLSCEPELFFNYTGVIDSEPESMLQDSPFGISDIPMGLAHGDQSDVVYNFDLKASIIDGSFWISASYLSTEYSEQNVKALLEQVKREIDRFNHSK